MRIILLTGVIGSGKDYFAKEYIKKHPNEKVKHLKFAASLRDITEGMFDIPKGDEEEYTKWKGLGDNRQFMVDLGRELKRVYGDDFFAEKIADSIFNDMDTCDTKDTYLISDFRFRIEFWTMFQSFPDKLQIIFCNYKSERYAICPEQVSEQMAIWLLGKGVEDRTELGTGFFAELMREYEGVSEGANEGVK